ISISRFASICASRAMVLILVASSPSSVADFFFRAHAAMTNQDYPTFNFLQWYVSEQHEEEKLFKSIIDKLSLAGKSGEGLYFIDKELSTLDTQN
ncbi:ferritin-like domain-containing protein, partial [Escherichia coli]